MIVLDAGVLVAYLNSNDSHHARARDFLIEHADDSFSVAAMTLAETLVHPVRTNNVLSAMESLMALEFDVEDMREKDALPLARLRETTRLRMPDAVVVHTAVAFDGSVATTDARLARAAEQMGVAAHLLA